MNSKNNLQFENRKWYWILKLHRNNYICDEGAVKLVNGVSKLRNLTSFNLEIK